MITTSPRKLAVSAVVYCCHVNASNVTSAASIISYISSPVSLTSDFNDILHTVPDHFIFLQTKSPSRKVKFQILF